MNFADFRLAYTRRETFRLGLGSLITAWFGSSMVSTMAAQSANDSPVSGPYTLPPLPYPYEALEPQIDTLTMQIHHDKHHKAYVDNANKLLGRPARVGEAFAGGVAQESRQGSRRRSALACATMWAGMSITPYFGR